jgi:hypothetical protein
MHNTATSSEWFLEMTSVMYVHWFIYFHSLILDYGTVQFGRIRGLVVRILGYRPRDLRFYSRRYKIFWEAVGLERVPFNLVAPI